MSENELEKQDSEETPAELVNEEAVDKLIAEEEGGDEAEKPEAEEPKAPPKTFDDYLQRKADALHGRAKRAEMELKRLKEERKIIDEERAQPSPQVQGMVDDERLDLRLKGYSRDEVAVIDSFAKLHKVSLSEAADMEVMKQSIETVRAKQRSIAASPSQGRATGLNDNPADKKTFASMSPAERSKHGNFEAWKHNKRIQSGRYR